MAWRVAKFDGDGGWFAQGEVPAVCQGQCDWCPDNIGGDGRTVGVRWCIEVARGLLGGKTRDGAMVKEVAPCGKLGNDGVVSVPSRVQLTEISS